MLVVRLSTPPPLRLLPTTFDLVFGFLITVWPRLPVSSSTGSQWIGPTRSAKGIRVAKHHLDSGGIVYVSRSMGEMAALVSRCTHEHTTEAGTLPNVCTHMSLDQSIPSAQEIDLAGTCFVGRASFPHERIPTCRYYSFVRSHGGLASHTSWMPQLLPHLSASWTWLRSIPPHTTFMFTHGWLTGVAIQRPVFAFPIATVVYAGFLRYFNTTFMDTGWWLGSRLGDGVLFGIYLIEKMTGGPTPDTLIDCHTFDLRDGTFRSIFSIRLGLFGLARLAAAGAFCSVLLG